MRIAIIRLSALGDVVIASSLLAGLKAMGDYRIEWFVDKNFSGILDYSPCLTKIHALPFKTLLKSIGGLLEIRQYCQSCGEYDMVIDMQGLLKSAVVGKCLNTRCFVGFDKNSARESWAAFFYTHKVEIPYDSNILERNFKVLLSHIAEFRANPFPLSRILPLRTQSLGIHYRDVPESLITHFSQLSHTEPKPYTFLFILEASIPEKMYPIEQYERLAALLQGLLGQCHFYLLWHDDEERATNLHARLSKQRFAVTKLPKLDFNALKFCLRQMDCVIGGDTGATHLAWAMGAPCITLYGNNATTSGKNMSQTKLERVLLGNPYVVSQQSGFEIASITPDDIFDVFKKQVYSEIAQEQDLM